MPCFINTHVCFTLDIATVWISRWGGQNSLNKVSGKQEHHFSLQYGGDQDPKTQDGADDHISPSAPPFPYWDKFCQSCHSSRVTELDLQRMQENSRQIEISGNLFRIRNVTKPCADKEVLTQDQSH